MKTQNFTIEQLKNMSDEELVLVSKSGDGYATETLMERYRNFDRYAFSLSLHRPQDAVKLKAANSAKKQLL